MDLCYILPQPRATLSDPRVVLLLNVITFKATYQADICYTTVSYHNYAYKATKKQFNNSVVQNN